MRIVVEILAGRSCGLEHLSNESVENRLADRCTTFLKLVRRFQVGHIKCSGVLIHGRYQRSVIQQIGHPVQQLMLHFDVRRLEHRARKHELPTQGYCLYLERLDVERLRVVNQRDVSTRLDQFGDRADMLIGVGQRSDVPR